jgi:sulfatase modifying factor 1
MTAARMLPLLATVCAAAVASADPVTYELVPIRDAGNANDVTGYGGVAHEYAIGRYEVTIDQFTAFLNAVAATDTYGLYNENMGLEPRVAGIAQSGSSGSYAYTVIGPSGTAPPGASSPGNRPATYVNWFRAARFANWMSNGQPTGGQDATTTEAGAYTLAGITSGTAPAVNAINPNTGAPPTYRLPTENEWYKAAYYKAGGTAAGYWAYATRSDTPPGNSIGGLPNQANYDTGTYAVTGQPGLLSNQNYLTEVGAFTGSDSAYGTFDQAGNVFEWNDLAGAAGETRGIRGGNWFNSTTFPMSSSFRVVDNASTDQAFGFRLASPAAVPEPSTWMLASLGLLGGWSLTRLGFLISPRAPGRSRGRSR